MGYDTPPPGYRQQIIRQVRAGRSPIADLIERHRAEMAKIWQRHAEELRHLVQNQRQAA
jgi:hypothetical protein